MYLKLSFFFLLLIIILTIILEIFFRSSKNNSCNSYWGYFNINFSKDCYYIPDTDRNITEIIKNHTGVCETHQVQTEDGYILTLFRIPVLNPKGVVLLQHPIAEDARIWVAQYNESVALLFWKKNYDVWLGNSRGTLFSKKHATLKPDDEKFWNFSFHEMGYYDHSATIDYIKKITNKPKIIYFGFSMGATSGLVYAAMRPLEAEDSIQVMINIAPVAYLRHTETPLTYLGPVYCFLERHGGVIGSYTSSKYYSWYLKLFRLINSVFPFKKIVVYIIALFSGWTPEEFDPKLFNLMMTLRGSEVSHKTSCHYYQIWRYGGYFRMYNYGKKENLRLYGSEKPSLYPLDRIKIPVLLHYSKNDTLSHFGDNEMLFSKLPEVAKSYGKTVIEGLNHVDYVFGKRRVEKVYDPIFRFLDNLGT